MFNDALKWIKKCDVIIVEASEKARGVYFETGYAKALNKKVIVIHKKGTEANLLEAMSDIKIEYENFEDLREKLMDEMKR
ncbi:nucleoside 2-deoxyribosyltransferase [Candidatus Pacearchaeota archaeon]|nr:nucleoside 2-deoxyribosyltransferase [Candidatus Pacearchaeota archaeon]